MGTAFITFILLDETSPDDELLFRCSQCPGKQFVSSELESHASLSHYQLEFLVDTATATRRRSS